MNDCKILELIFETKLPKYKEDYEQEIILHIVGMCFILFLILHGWKNTDLDRLFAFIFGLTSVFIFYEKFYQYVIVTL